MRYGEILVWLPPPLSREGLTEEDPEECRGEASASCRRRRVGAIVASTARRVDGVEQTGGGGAEQKNY